MERVYARRGETQGERAFLVERLLVRVESGKVKGSWRKGVKKGRGMTWSGGTRLGRYWKNQMMARSDLSACAVVDGGVQGSHFVLQV